MKVNLEEIDQHIITSKIDDLLTEIYQFMPSNGSYPFTMIRVAHSELSDLNIASKVDSKVHILVLKRTDFSKPDWVDYIIKSTEYMHIYPDAQKAFLESYLLKYAKPSDQQNWREHITGMGIGIVMQLARQKELCLSLVDTNLTEIDSHFGLQAQKLSAYQLFDVRQI